MDQWHSFLYNGLLAINKYLLDRRDWGLNQQPPTYESSNLPTELSQ